MPGSRHPALAGMAFDGRSRARFLTNAPFAARAGLGIVVLTEIHRQNQESCDADRRRRGTRAREAHFRFEAGCPAGGRGARERGKEARCEGAPARAPRRVLSAGSLSRHVEGAARDRFVSDPRRLAGSAGVVREGVRARALPARALLDPGRPYAPDRRGGGSGRARPGNEVAGGALRTRGESRARAERARAERPVPPARAPHAARGAARARLRAAQRAEALGCADEAARAEGRRDAARPRFVGALVRRMEARW
jgi:hypothetical protein